MRIDADDPVGTLLITAIRDGDRPTVHRLVTQQSGLAGARLAAAKGRTPLHVVTDWPGYYPEGPAIAQALIDAGADVDARSEGRTTETPLHWAASSDDVDVAEVLMSAGADLEAAGGSIGTPLDNAIGYGCWHVARRLVERGVAVDKLWHAAALGDLHRLRQLLDADPAPGRDDLDEALWQAAHGGQLRAADLLVRRGADIRAVPGYADGGTIVAIAGGPDTRREQLRSWLLERGATE
ncbi:MAG TPA: ankyrin repeat domain-containing protein [Micromonosporaceae bacterium]|jgi:hypothetical protein